MRNANVRTPQAGATHLRILQPALPPRRAARDAPAACRVDRRAPHHERRERGVRALRKQRAQRGRRLPRREAAGHVRRRLQQRRQRRRERARALLATTATAAVTRRHRHGSCRQQVEKLPRVRQREPREKRHQPRRDARARPRSQLGRGRRD